MRPETYDPSFLIDLVYSILQRGRLCGSLSESVRKIVVNGQKRLGQSPSLSIIFGLSSKTQWLSGLYYADFISFTALLNCAEVGRRNRIPNE